MSGFIRPEVAATLIKWHEVLIAIAAFLLGLYFTQLSGPVVQGLGIVLIVLGLGYVVVGLRRLRFRGSGAAPGAVRITEGQITYLGPLQGGAVALSLITELRLRDPQGLASGGSSLRPMMFWRSCTMRQVQRRCLMFLQRCRACLPNTCCALCAEHRQVTLLFGNAQVNPG